MPKLLDALNESKLAEHTIVVFLGDHGYELGLRNWWNKNTLFEKSCRTPLIIRVSGAKAQGQAKASIVEFIDLYPTLAELCQLNGVPQDLEGESFSRISIDPTAQIKGAALTVLQRGATRGRSLRTEVYRYTEWDNGRNGVELYDHRRDPEEWINLAQDPETAETCRELSARMTQLETPIW